MTPLESWLRTYCPDLLTDWNGQEATTSASFCQFGVSAEGFEIHVRLLQDRRYRDILIAFGPSGAVGGLWRSLPEYVPHEHVERPARQPARHRETADWVDSEEGEFNEAT